MKAQLACIPCIMKQAYNTARRATKDEKLIREILNRTNEYLMTVNLDTTPADASYFVYDITREITGNKDPYEVDKKRYNDLVFSKIEELRKTIEESEDPVETAVKMAVLGNVIDLGIGYVFDLESELKRVMQLSFAAYDYPEFKIRTKSGRKKILYLLDNCGEMVFDMLLMERIYKDHDITAVVKKAPIINDATMKEADEIGMTKQVRVIDTGSDGIGVKWSEVTEEFEGYYKEADIIISKGQGNFETMSDRDKNIYFLLRAKCESVAEILGVKFGDVVFKKGPLK